MVILGGSSLTLEELERAARGNESVELSDAARFSIRESRRRLEKAASGSQPVYGVNTGFGDFSEIKISRDKLRELQRNLIVSHSCGTGDPMTRDAVRAMMILRVNALARGFSGIRLETVEMIVRMLNKGIHPVVPEKGSLGASGDLAPLAHMALAMIGEGDAEYDSCIMPSAEALSKAGLEPVVLEEKEGLALINGTQALTAIGALALADSFRAYYLANLSGALTMEALRGITTAYDPRLQSSRGHRGQMETADIMLRLVRGSELTTVQNEIRVQDAYSIRCIPQVHGAVKDTLDYAREKVEIEMNAVTDNPIVLSDTEIYSGGNFHGEPMALVFDFLSIAVSELASISERRLERLVNHQLSGLPPFLADKGGLNSGFMIVQYSAASLVSENKTLAHPASVDSIPSSANQEDHVSMGNFAARKYREIVKNTTRVISMEAFTACQAIDFRPGELTLGIGTGEAYRKIRETVPFIENDTIMFKEMDKVLQIFTEYDLGKII